jgi:hypothetical protein
MFGSPLPAVADTTQIPGRAAFEQRTDAVAAFLGGDSPDAAFAASMLIWQLLHGTVSLRISRPVFPWPPLEETVDRGIDLILDDAAAGEHKTR